MAREGDCAGHDLPLSAAGGGLGSRRTAGELVMVTWAAFAARWLRAAASAGAGVHWRRW